MEATMKILAADDDPIQLFGMRSILFQHELLTVESGEEVLEELFDKGHKYDLLITDRNMPPGLKGIEVVRRIRANKLFRWLPVIMISSDHSPVYELTELGGIFMKKEQIEDLPELVDYLGVRH
jgi:CheY-like chemotaxis protein